MLSLWVLVLVFKFGYGNAAVQIEMPTQETCMREGKRLDNDVKFWTCVNRTESK